MAEVLQLRKPVVSNFSELAISVSYCRSRECQLCQMRDPTCTVKTLLFLERLLFVLGDFKFF